MPSHPARPTPSRRRVLVVRVLAVVAAVCYSGWIFSPSPAPARTSYISELAVAGQPGAALLRGLDLTAGVAALLATVLAARAGWPPGRRLRAATLTGVAGFGAATVLDALFPLSCAPTLSAECRAADQAGDVPWTHAVHGVTSSLAGGFILLGVLGVALTVWRSDQRYSTAQRLLHALFAVLMTATTIWVVVEIAGAGELPVLPAPPSADALGWSQRAQLLTVSAWLAVVGIFPTIREGGEPYEAGQRRHGERTP